MIFSSNSTCSLCMSKVKHKVVFETHRLLGMYNLPINKNMAIVNLLIFRGSLGVYYDG